MQMKITERGRELVRSPEFVASLVNFMKEWDGPSDLGADNMGRMICLGLCEIDSEHGPALDSPELEAFVTKHKAEIEEVGSSIVPLLCALSSRSVN